MALSAGDSLDDAIGRLGDRRALQAFLALYVAFLGLVVGAQTQLQAQPDDLLAENPFFTEELVLEEYNLALDVSFGLASLLWLVGLVAFVAASIVAFRSLLARGDGESVPMVDLDALGLLLATAHGVAAAVLGLVAVGIGFALLVVPGLVLATVLALTHPYIAVDRAGVVEAMGRSVESTRGHRLQLFGVLVLVVMTFLAVSLMGGLLATLIGGTTALGEVLNVGVTAFAWLVTLAVLASAFEQLETSRAEREAKWEDIDDELLP